MAVGSSSSRIIVVLTLLETEMRPEMVRVLRSSIEAGLGLGYVESLNYTGVIHWDQETGGWVEDEKEDEDEEEKEDEDERRLRLRPRLRFVARTKVQ
jgi:hypothetical protein